MRQPWHHLGSPSLHGDSVPAPENTEQPPPQGASRGQSRGPPPGAPSVTHSCVFHLPCVSHWGRVCCVAFRPWALHVVSWLAPHPSSLRGLHRPTEPLGAKAREVSCAHDLRSIGPSRPHLQAADPALIPTTSPHLQLRPGLQAGHSS